MKRFSVIAATAALLVAVSAPAALAAPGNGVSWDTSVWQCDEGLGDQWISIHNGNWSAVYFPETRDQLILTYQSAVLDGVPFLDLAHPGHTNPGGPIVTCTVTDDGTAFPAGTVITIQGFFMP